MMGYNSFRRFTLVLFTSMALGLTAQNGGSWYSLYPEAVLEDMEVLFTTLKECHPALYDQTTERRLEALMDSILASVSTPLAGEEVMSALRPLLKEIQDPDLQMLPSDEMLDRHRESTPLLPIDMAIFEEGLYVEDELIGHQNIPPGSRIFFINGLSDEQIIARMLGGIVTAPGNRTAAFREMDQHFPELYHRFVDDGMEFELMYEDPQGGLHRKVVQGLTKVEMETSMASMEQQTERAEMHFDLEARFGYLRIPSFDPEDLKKAGQDLERLYKDFFKRVEDHNSIAVLIDLRGNEGGSIQMAEMLYAYFAPGPFRAIQDVWVNTPDKPTYFEYTKGSDKFYRNIDQSYAQNLAGKYSIEPSHPALEYEDPSDYRFDGKVFILVDGATKNAGAVPAMLAQEVGNSMIVGEETGGFAHKFSGAEVLELTLPNSGIKFRMPLQKLWFDMEGGHVQGGLPVDQHIEQDPHDLAKGRDTAVEALRRLLLEYR